MAFPISKTNAVDTETEIVAAHINNLENKVGIDNSGDTASLDYEVKHHKSRHENGGADEISISGLSGLLADSQTPLAHKTSHQNGGGDEISVDGLSGTLADKQDADKIQGHIVDEAALGNDKVLVYKSATATFVYETKGTPSVHASSHEDGGGDEISVDGLSGALADKQDASKIQGHTVDETALGNDKVLVYKSATTTFVYEAKGTPAGHHESHENGGGDEITVEGLSGLLADAQKVTVRKNSGANVGTRKRLNLIEGSNITLTVADDAVDDEVDVTIVGAAGGGGDFLVIQVFS